MQINRDLRNSVITAVLAVWAVALAGFKGRDLYGNWVSIRRNDAARNVTNWQTLVAGRAPILGTRSASFTIIEFSDYQCPYCGMIDSVLVKFATKHHSDVVIYRYDMPLRQIHPYAYTASLAANCAELQGVVQPYQSLLFQHQKEFAALDWTALAKQSGIRDVDAFTRCVRDEVPREHIRKDLEAGEWLKLTGTPSFIVNGTLTEAVSEAKLESLYAGAHRGKHRFYNPFNR